MQQLLGPPVTLDTRIRLCFQSLEEGDRGGAEEAVSACRRHTTHTERPEEAVAPAACRWLHEHQTT